MSPLKFFSTFKPRLSAAPAGMVAMSSSGGAGLGGGGTPTGGGGGGSAGGEPPYSGPPRPDRSGRLPGQERTVSYQPEERYWTDYLRIALPVVGLLLMLGLFWYWASQLIGSDTNEPVSTPTAGEVAIENAATHTPTVEPTIVLTPETGVEDEPTPEPPPTPTPTQEPEAEDPEPENDVFQVGDIVVTTQENVNFRAAPVDGNIIDALSANTELRVTGAPEEDAEGFLWYPLSNDVSGDSGYIREDLIERAE